MSHQWTRIIVQLQITLFVYCESQYSIVAPGVVASNRNYSVSVSLHNATRSATIRIGIRESQALFNLDSQLVTLQPFQTKLVDLQPPKLYEEYKYELWAEGVDGIEIDQRVQLTSWEADGPRVFIESDKGTYKSEDMVQFRVIVLDRHLRWIKIREPIKVQILDPQGNRIKQFKDIQLSRGVFAGQFQLSRYPLLGEWLIRVYLSGKYDMEVDKKFKVDEYVLPKFSVTIVTESHVIGTEEHTLNGLIYGQYTHGLYVQGKVLVALYARWGWKLGELSTEINNEDPKAAFSFHIRDFRLERMLHVQANLTDKYSNETVTANAYIAVHLESYKIVIPENEIEFRNSLPYRLKVYVQHWNDTKVIDPTTPVLLQLDSQNLTSTLNENGTAVFEFKPGNYSGYRFSFKDTSIETLIFGGITYYTSRNELKTDCFCRKISNSSGFPDLVEIEVNTDHNIPYFIYTITSHANIIHSELVAVLPNQKTYTIRIRPTIAMIPKSFIYVYYIVKNNWQYCETYIELPETFENKISITGPSQAKPGENITLKIKAQPDSHVSIVAVDLGVIELNSANILRKSKIMSDLKHDRSYQDIFALRYPGIISGLITLTSAMITDPFVQNDLTWMEHSGKFPVVIPNLSKISLRSKFPETWIFKDIEITNETTSLKLEVPDTITTWVFRAFSVNDRTGLGMMEEPLEIKGFQPFFISPNIPYSIKRGEIVNIPVTIFNNLQDDLQTTVIMDNSKDEFQFVDNAGKRIANKSVDIREVNVTARNREGITFTISPKRVGDIDIKIAASNDITADGIVQKLKVEPEGIAQDFNEVKFIKLERDQSYELRFLSTIPSNIVPDSAYITLAMGGDIMANSLDNLHDLVHQPKGCGEQNMINLAPNILVLDYLRDLEQSSNYSLLAAKALNYIELGYQQQLTYRHDSGAFSVFGPKADSKENNWLTAYVIRFLIKGTKYTGIDPKVIESGLQYLANQQLEDGTFPHRGYLFYAAHQNRYGFTAFVLLTFYEDENYALKYDTVIQKGLNFLTQNIANVKDVYSLAIMANVLLLGRVDSAKAIIARLNAVANVQNRKKWWTNNKKGEETANDVEITSYVLMALLETPGDHWPIFYWLMEQRNSHGGFKSTHDTVVGLEALTKFSKRFGSAVTRMKIHYEAFDKYSQSIWEGVVGIDEDNLLILQNQELPPTTRSVIVKSMGQGNTFVQFAYQYYSNEMIEPQYQMLSSAAPAAAIKPPEYFNIEPMAKMTTPKEMTLKVCFSYQPRGAEGSRTNMVIMQIKFPSGFVSNSKSQESLLANSLISRIEVEESAAKMLIYFEKLEAQTKACLSIVANKMQEVSALKPSLIEMYDYYDTKRRSTALYSYEVQH